MSGIGLVANVPTTTSINATVSCQLNRPIPASSVKPSRFPCSSASCRCNTEQCAGTTSVAASLNFEPQALQESIDTGTLNVLDSPESLRWHALQWVINRHWWRRQIAVQPISQARRRLGTASSRRH